MIAEQTQIVELPRAPQPIADRAEIAISVRGVGKMYRIYDRPQDRLKQMLWRGRRMYGHEFWALRNISFDIQKGETVGIIGRNGSGKSTLLQIIAGTLNPTEGEVEVKGRVAALLELGSGFNPDFTGRENVFLNGAILGISREEMELRFDDIAAFADIGEFIDQPVKLYSSGMVVRLAFAVQAFVPKEVLIIDEALAVGDMFFQAKCMAQMKRLMDDGVTVLFVSHDTGAVKSLCRRAMLLQQGQLIDVGTVDKVTEKYFALKIQSEQTVVSLAEQHSSTSLLSSGSEQSRSAFTSTAQFQRRAAFQRSQNGKAYFVNVQLLNWHEEEISYIEYDQEVTLRMAIEIMKDIPSCLLHGYQIKNYSGLEVVYSDSVIEGKNLIEPREGEKYLIDWRFKAALSYGNYTITTVLSIPIDLTSSKVDFCDLVPIAVQFTVAPRPEAPIHGSVHWGNTIEVRLC